VLQGRARELGSIKSFKVVLREIPEDQVPQGTVVIPMRFLYKLKPNGLVKARLVVQQVKHFASGISWTQTFAATPTSVAHRVLLWYAMRNHWPINDGDVSTAFLHADLPPEMKVIVRPPSCIYRGMVWLLRKALYGLKVAPQCFQRWFVQQMESLAFRRLTADGQMFHRAKDGALDLTHADDCRLTSAEEFLKPIKKQIGQKMSIKWEELPLNENWKDFLGLQWRRLTSTKIQVRPDPKHLTRLVQMQNLDGAKSVTTPKWSTQLEREVSETLPPAESKEYRSGVGLVQWIMLSRMDLQFSGKELARALSQPTRRDKARLRRLTRYMMGTAKLVQVLELDEKADLVIVVFVDANFAGDETRKSTTGFVVLLQGVVIAFGSHTQATIALSTAEAELMALNTGVREALFVQSVLTEVIQQTIPIIAYTDSTACLGIVHKVGAGRLRHIETKQLWLQQVVAERKVEIRKIGTEQNLADILTKQLEARKLPAVRQALQMEEVE